MPLADTYAFNAMKQKEGSRQEMTMQEALDYYRVETHSKILPYVVRDHAWNFGHHDQTNFYRYKEDAPEGYRDVIEYRKPHPTNVPVPPKVIVDVVEKEKPDDHADEIEEAEKNKTKAAAAAAAEVAAKAQTAAKAQANQTSNATQIASKANTTLN